MEATWGWGALGLLLLGLEMATGTFYVVWFGVAALLVAVALLITPDISQAAQIITFAVLSLGSLTVWKRYYKKTETHSKVGQAQGEEIGRVGMVTVSTSNTTTGKINFLQGVMGSREWVAVSNDPIDAGEEAALVAVEGNILRVKQI
ncbi:MAG: NfeD family protein [Methylophilaceae bacterium]|nr:NfeD family protein [Methylophilaceae bacterium]